MHNQLPTISENLDVLVRMMLGRSPPSHVPYPSYLGHLLELWSSKWSTYAHVLLYIKVKQLL